MKAQDGYTIFIPTMAPIHFTLLRNLFIHYGYNVKILDSNAKSIVTQGLKYVHNDTCYPALLVIGQFIDELKSGKYDTKKVALMITQTGGGCRASNYINLLRKALRKAGFEHVPVLSVNFSGLEKSSAFQMTVPMFKRILATFVYGDALMLLRNQVKPYECNPGQTEQVTQQMIDEISAELQKGKGCSLRDYGKNIYTAAKRYAEIPVATADKIKVGIVGEIYVKYSHIGNNDLENFLAEHGCEVNVPGILDFVMYTLDTRLEDYKLYGGDLKSYLVVKAVMRYFVAIQNAYIKAVKKVGKFAAPSPFYKVKSLIQGVIGAGNKMGEGWLLTAEMLELAHTGYQNIVCAQPFGCLPNHVCGKGMLRKIKDLHPSVNIVAIDYDPGASRVNQENRLLLMLSVARDNLNRRSG